MNFSWPAVLILLIWVLKSRKKQSYRSISISGLSDWKNAAQTKKTRWLRIVPFLRKTALALLVIALARPYAERSVSEEVRQGIAMQILIDISNSMEEKIQDFDGEEILRIEAAKKTVEEFVKNRPDDLIGLLTFARYPDTLSPLTFSHGALAQLVREVYIPDRRNEDGTAYGDAVSLACARLAQMHEWNEESRHRIASRIVILLTDGENNCGQHMPMEAAGLSEKWNIQIYTISLGAPEQTDETEDEKLLRAISENSGGGFWKIFNQQQLSEAYERIDQLERTTIKNTTLTRNEQRPIFHFFAIPALILLLIELILSNTILHVTEEPA